MKIKTDIYQLCNTLAKEHYQDLTIEPYADADQERIKQLALSRLNSPNDSVKKEIKKDMKKLPHKILIAAAIIALFATTAFAASQTDFFRSLFGDSISNVENNIQTVAVSAEDDNFKLNAEQLLSDGFNTKIIVSLEAKNDKIKSLLSNPQYIINITADTPNVSSDKAVINSTGTERLPQFDTKDKLYFCISYGASKDYSNQPITLVLNNITDVSKDLSTSDSVIIQPELTLVIENPSSINNQKRIEFEQNGQAIDGTYPVSLIVNSISGVLTLQEPENSTNTPTLDVILVMKDGKKEKIFDKGWIAEDGIGGGGRYMSDDPSTMPLASGNSYMRDLETSIIVQTSSFSRILNVDDVSYVLVDGKRFDFK